MEIAFDKNFVIVIIIIESVVHLEKNSPRFSTSLSTSDKCLSEFSPAASSTNILALFSLRGSKITTFISLCKDIAILHGIMNMMGQNGGSDYFNNWYFVE